MCASTPRPVDVRIVAASNQPLAGLVEQGRFRADMYYRLNKFLLAVPPLRERPEDLPFLVEHILQGLRHRLRRTIAGPSRRFLAQLTQHRGPGNVRELQHVLCKAALLEDGEVLEVDHFTPTSSALGPPSGPPADASELRFRAAREALEQAGGNKSRAAQALGVTRKTLYAWLGRRGRSPDR